jgi:hypothetical protein
VPPVALERTAYGGEAVRLRRVTMAVTVTPT